MRRLALVFAVASLTGALLSSGPALAQTLPSSSAALLLPETLVASSSAPLVISGTADADLITIQQNADGSLTVTLQGHPQTVAALDVPGLVIDGEAGNDAIIADATVSEGLTIFGGTGNDVIDDGGSGAAYVDGGPGDDSIHSGTGLGILFGGAGDDQLTVRGDGGLMAGGPGGDSYGGGSSSTQLFAQRGEEIASPGYVTWVRLSSTDAAGHAPGYVVRTVGAAGFRERVSAVVTAVLSVPNGRKLLTTLDDAGHSVTISQATGGNQTAILDPANAFLGAGGRHGTGSDCAVSYSPYETVLQGGALEWQRRPPIVGLVHELVHALNAATGTLQPGKNAADVLKLELQAIGLPYEGIAFRWNAGSAASPNNPRVFTENGFRALLGLAPRTAY